MKVIEIKSKIKNNKISIPLKIQTELKNEDEYVKVFVVVDDTNTKDEVIFRENAQKQLLEGYAKSDSIYDSY